MWVAPWRLSAARAVSRSNPLYCASVNKRGEHDRDRARQPLVSRHSNAPAQAAYQQRHQRKTDGEEQERSSPMIRKQKALARQPQRDGAAGQLATPRERGRLII